MDSGFKEEIASQFSVENQESKWGHLVSGYNDDKNLISNKERSEIGSCTLELLLSSIPNHTTTSDEKYLLNCLQLLHNYSMKNSCWNSSNSHISPLDSSSAACDLVCSDLKFFDITGSNQSMQNILKRSLFKRLGSTDSNLSHNYLISHETQSKPAVVDHKSISVSSYRRASSVSSMNSSFSNKSCLSSLRSSFRGTLQCSWKDGLPHHVFSVEDKRELFRVQGSKMESLDEYTYTFYEAKQGKRDCDAPEMETVATMRVSKSVTLSSSLKKITETKFILYASSDDHGEELNTNHSNKKNESLSKKVPSVLRSGRSSKRRTRTLSRTWDSSSSTIVEDTLWESPAESQNDIHPLSHEVAAFILHETRHYPMDAGGWGLKFLKKSRNGSDNGEFSTSMKVLIPAGLHGGIKQRGDGPSCLVERWISGGGCDCGGWDMGCPLTVLETPSLENSSREYRPVNLFIQGSRGYLPVFSMVKICDGLYDISFQSTVSCLQCFGIAAAVFHSQNHSLQSAKTELG